MDTFGLNSVGAGIIVGSDYLKIKNKKNCSGLGLRNPKKGGSEVGVEVSDYLGVMPSSLIETHTGPNRFFY